jgi:hypothetical protein
MTGVVDKHQSVSSITTLDGLRDRGPTNGQPARPRIFAEVQSVHSPNGAQAVRTGARSSSHLYQHH